MFETIALQIRELINNGVFLTVGSLLHREGRVHKRFALLVSSALCLLFFGGNDNRAIFCLTITLGAGCSKNGLR